MACRDCKGKGYRYEERDGYRVVVPCGCQRLHRMRRTLDRSGIPPRFQKWTLQARKEGERRPFKPGAGIQVKALSPEDQARFAEARSSQQLALARMRELLRLFLRSFKEQHQVELPGVLLSGSCGLGKTHLVAALLVDLICQGVKKVRFVEYTSLLRRIRFSYSDGVTSEKTILGPLVAADVLVLDDLGAEASDNLTWLRDILGYLLNERYSAQRPTLITTNYPDAIPSSGKNAGPTSSILTLTDRIGVRLRSRIEEMCPKLSMTGLDLRQVLSSTEALQG